MTQASARRRPTSLAEMDAMRNPQAAEAGKQYWQSFQPLPSDVIISPFGKSGTTWTQQIVHGLRTRGDMDFDDISRVTPWLETAYQLGLDLNAPQRAHPRVFKSHLNWHDMPKGGRYIVSVRDPKDVLVSSYRFMEGWWFEPGTISIEEWARERFMNNREKGYWQHLISWWEQRNNKDVLLLSYENMKADMSTTVRTIADFLHIELDAGLFEIVLRQSSLPFMLAHKDKFDDLMMREWTEREHNLPPGSDSAKVRKGEVGSHRYELPPDISDELDKIWQEEIEPTLGFASYQELRSALTDGRA